MQLKAIALVLPLLVVQPASFAQGLEKNGLPCVTEICLGDGLAELAKIQWTPAHTSFKINNKVQATSERKLSEDDLRLLKANYPDLGDAAPFVYEKQFDSSALPTLSKVSAACEVNELFGTFGNSSAPTKVGISLMPVAAGPTRHAWTVTSIVREFPSASTIEQKANLTLLLKRSYGKFGAGSRELPPAKPGEGRFFLGGMANFGFGLSLVRATDEGERMKAHALCTAADKVKGLPK